MMKHELDRLSRRSLLKGSLSLGFIFGVPGFISRVQAEGELFNPANRTATDSTPHMKGDFAPNAFIRINAQGPIILILPNIEMGQGTHTAEAMLLAEEMDVALDQVQAFDAPPDADAYGNPQLQLQATGGSTSIRSQWTSLREAGAVARQMLVAAAALEWGVNVDSCRTDKGTVIHSASGRALSYGALVVKAAAGPVPKTVGLKDLKDYKLIGTSAPRIDTPAKANGTAVFGIDVKVLGMKVGTVMACPVYGGKIASIDETEARKIPGIVDILRIDNAVAVVSDNYWTALQGLKALQIVWDEGANANLTTEDLFSDLKKVVAVDQPLSVVNKGDTAKGLLAAAKTLKVEYQMPFLAHAPMEPINCTIHARGDSADVWVGTQVPVLAQKAVAKILGLKPEAVTLHNHYMGGAFGRRLFIENIEQIAAFAKQVQYPLKIVWSREEDLMHDRYRPGYYDRLEMGLTKDGQITALNWLTANGSATSAFVPDGVPMGKVDPDVSEGVSSIAYDIPALKVGWVRHDPAVPIGYWRGVGPGHSFFVLESLIDEAAHELGIDPVKFRQGLLSNSPRALAVLNLAAEKSGWGKKLPKGRGMGVAFHNAFGSFMASVLEVELTPEGELLMINAVVAVDCGQAVNPNIVEAQVQGGFVFGLSAALYNQVTFAKGRAEQKNFNDYRILRINEMPSLEVHMIQNHESPGGIGETATVSAPPTLANAVFAATGQRQRFMPIDRQALANSVGKK